MGEALRSRLKQSRFESVHQEAMLNLLVAAGCVRDALDTACQRHGVTRGQYNVLRILAGAHPDGYARNEIARRLIERSPDVTRLIDRLELRGLIERRESDRDRRLSMARITRRGLQLLERMLPDIEQVTARLTAPWSAAEAEELSRLCERLYDAETPATAAAASEGERT